MAQPPVETGEIPDGGAIQLLRELETQSLTGVLQFESLAGDVEGEIALFGGEIAVDQPARDDGSDPVDLFLGVGAARYRLLRKLPPLPVSKGGDYVKTGSLAVHVPADLMGYCEKAGLTGVLQLRHEERRAEAIYRGGELLAIELDGEDAGDLHEVFAWEQGRFRIELEMGAPERVDEEEASAPTRDWRPAPAKKREDTRQFLRVVEMALADVVTESEKARSPTRTSPPLPPPPKARPRPEAVGPPAPRPKTRDQTVRLIYLTGETPAYDADTSTRHVQARRTTEPALTEARPERRAAPHAEDEQEPEPMAKKKKTTKTSSPGTPASAEKAGAAAVEEDGTASAGATDEGAGETEAGETEAAPVAPSGATAKTPAQTAPPEGERAADPVTSGPLLAAAGWTFAFFGVGLLVLMFLSVLPPVSCPPGREDCGWGAGCVSPSSDPEHCGACGNVCTSGRCVFGECGE